MFCCLFGYNKRKVLLKTRVRRLSAMICFWIAPNVSQWLAWVCNLWLKMVQDPQSLIQTRFSNMTMSSVLFCRLLGACPGRNMRPTLSNLDNKSHVKKELGNILRVCNHYIANFFPQNFASESIRVWLQTNLMHTKKNNMCFFFKKKFQNKKKMKRPWRYLGGARLCISQ